MGLAKTERTIAERLGEFCDSLSYEKIPVSVTEKIKDFILDTLGICVASSKMDFGNAALSLIVGWGGKPESSLIGSRAKVPAQNAVFANGILGHGQDYDDGHKEAVVHPSACLVPVGLAMGERNGCSGREILTALVGGMEVMIRIGLVAPNKFHLGGFHATSICGTFASALTAAKVMGFGRDKMVQALGISGSFTSGLLECISGSWAKRLHAGWPALCGVVAAELADVGYTGPNTIFEGRFGLYNSFVRSESKDLSDLFKGLGTDWEILNVTAKRYPSCGFLHSYLDCASYLRKEHSVRPNDIAKIDLMVFQEGVNIVCEPWQKKICPETAYDARFSLPFAVSLMLAKGKAGVEEFFSEKYLSDPEIKGLLAITDYKVEPSLHYKDNPGWVKLRLKNGDKLEYRIDQAIPPTRKELLEKYYENAVSLGQGRSERIAEQLFEFERIKQIGDLMGELS